MSGWGAKPNMAKPDPSIPDRPELFCTGCQQWKPRAQIVAAKWVARGTGRQAQYFCRPCQDRRIPPRGPRHGG